MKMITIPYEDYKDLLQQSSMLDAILHDINYEINEAELTYDLKNLNLDSDLRKIAKKYCYSIYNKKFNELKNEKENKDNE